MLIYGTNFPIFLQIIFKFSNNQSIYSLFLISIYSINIFYFHQKARVSSQIHYVPGIRAIIFTKSISQFSEKSIMNFHMLSYLLNLVNKTLMNEFFKGGRKRSFYPNSIIFKSKTIRKKTILEYQQIVI